MALPEIRPAGLPPAQGGGASSRTAEESQPLIQLACKGKCGAGLKELATEPGSEVYYPNKQLQSATLAYPQEIGGFFCREERPVRFYKSGKLEACVLWKTRGFAEAYWAEDTVIAFFENGRVKQGTLVKPQTIAGLVLAKGGMVTFDKEGELLRGTLSEPAIIGGVKVQAGDVQLYPGMKVQQAKLAEGFSTGGVDIPAGSLVTFFKSGALEEAQIVAPLQVKQIACGSEFPVVFYESGQLEAAEMAQDATIGDIVFPKGTHVGFDKKGRVEWAEFAADHTLQGKQIPAKGTIHFNKNGKIMKIDAPLSPEEEDDLYSE